MVHLSPNRPGGNGGSIVCLQTWVQCWITSLLTSLVAMLVHLNTRLMATMVHLSAYKHCNLIVLSSGDKLALEYPQMFFCSSDTPRGFNLRLPIWHPWRNCVIYKRSRPLPTKKHFSHITPWKHGVIGEIQFINLLLHLDRNDSFPNSASASHFERRNLNCGQACFKLVNQQCQLGL